MTTFLNRRLGIGLFGLAFQAAAATQGQGQNLTTFRQILEAGGMTMQFIVALSVLATFLVIFFVLTLRAGVLYPKSFLQEAEDAAGEGDVILSFMDRSFEPLGKVEVPLARFKTGKAAWQDLGGAGEILLSGPFMVRATVRGALRGRVKIGCDTSGGGGHCFFFVPGSYAEAPSGPHDWMFRVFLANAGAMDKKELDAVLRKFRREIPR